VVLFEIGDGLGLTIFQDLKIVFTQAGDGLPFAIGYDNIYEDQSDFCFDGLDGFAGGGRSLRMQSQDRNQRNETKESEAMTKMHNSSTRHGTLSQTIRRGRGFGWAI
jgi:hypothetical protein